MVSISIDLVCDASQCVLIAVSYGNQGCQAGSVEGAFRYVVSSGGVDTENAYPYVARVSFELMQE